MYFVYILCCRDGSLYTGWSTDPQRRLTVHNSGKGAKYTRSRRPVRLVYQEVCPSREAALKCEWQIKQLSRTEKLLLIQEKDGSHEIQEKT